MVEKRILCTVIACAAAWMIMGTVPVSAEQDLHKNSSSFSECDLEKLLPQIENAQDVMVALSSNNSNPYAENALTAMAGDDYAYCDMEYRSNTENRQRFYQRLMKSMEDYWNSTEDALLIENIEIGTVYLLDMAPLDELGLTFDEATEVYEMFRCDNPIFYYASNTFLGFPISEDEIYCGILCYDDFAKGEDRAKYNEQILPYIKTYASCINEDSIYLSALSIHDKLIADVDFAYQEDGVTPSDTGIAHSIIGAIEGLGTCETYAKTYQLLCNYYGIRNMLVTGCTRKGMSVQNGHTWNLLLMDDGKYYYVDCTGDDEGGDAASRYFFAIGSKKLDLTHTMNTPDNTAVDFLYALPEVGEEDYHFEIAGDLTADGSVTISDLVVLQKWLLGNDVLGENWSSADLNQDGIVNVNDMVLLKRILLAETAD